MSIDANGLVLTWQLVEEENLFKFILEQKSKII
jgi:hypothetical protein